MSILYIECNMGAAGDMLLSALSELMPDQKAFIDKLNSMNLPNIEYLLEHTKKCGVTGSHIKVLVHGKEEHEHNHEHSHSHEHSHNHYGLKEVKNIISKCSVKSSVKLNAIAVYNEIAKAESKAHNEPVDQIHFHEVGSLDAIADVMGVCMAINEIDPDEIICSPIHVGYGSVKCAHGILPVPAPATLYLLQGIPIYSGDIEGELCTPTGAAILRHFSEKFCALPQMVIDQVGIGCGNKDFKKANIVRVYLAENTNANNNSELTDEVIELSCNIDDMTGEEISFASEILMENGALDVYSESIYMKKGRPGIKFNCICKPEDSLNLSKLIFKHTTSLGIRQNRFSRYILNRNIVDKNYSDQIISVKESYGYDAKKEKYEFEDLKRLAKIKNESVFFIRNHIK